MKRKIVIEIDCGVVECGKCPHREHTYCRLFFDSVGRYDEFKSTLYRYERCAPCIASEAKG